MEVQGKFDPDLTFESERLVEVLDYWRALRGARRMPSHDDIDPLNIPHHLLPHLELIDVGREPELRLRWRLIGTHITAAVNRDATGQYFDEYYLVDDFPIISGPFEWVIKNMEPLRWAGTSGFTGRDWLSFECALFPLSGDGEAVDMIFGAVHYDLR
jgi:hypothetical protein